MRPLIPIVALALSGSLCVSAPAAAQIAGRIVVPTAGSSVTPRGPSIGQQLRKTRRDIRNGLESGQLTRREAKALRRQAARIAAMAERHAEGGLSGPETAALESQAEMLRGAVVAQRSAPKR